MLNNNNNNNNNIYYYYIMKKIREITTLYDIVQQNLLL